MSSLGAWLALNSETAALSSSSDQQSSEELPASLDGTFWFLRVCEGGELSGDEALENNLVPQVVLLGFSFSVHQSSLEKKLL